ncbi:MAG: archease [Euryarchaeota archaeon]|nr:archease [Euryarchaeota archaeon]
MPPQENKTRREGFEYLPHTADAKFRAYGATIEEAFENAARAMFNVMIDTQPVLSKVSKSIEVTSADLDGLLVDWLSELLYLFEVESVVFADFSISSIHRDNNEYSLLATAYGEPIDLMRHQFNTEVKAVTYNGLEITELDQEWVVQVIVDI